MTTELDIPLNRAQRRAMKRMEGKRLVPEFTKEQGLHRQEVALASHRMDATEQEDVDKLMGPLLMQLERLRIGKLDKTGFDLLAMGACFTFTLASRIHEYGTDDSKAVIEPVQPIAEAAADQVAVLGERYRLHKRFGASAECLAAFREAFDILEQMIRVAPRGHVYTALREAKGLTLNANSPAVQAAIAKAKGG